MEDEKFGCINEYSLLFGGYNTCIVIVCWRSEKYCDVVWNSCSKYESDHLEKLQNYAAKSIVRKGRDFSLTTTREILSL